MDRAQRQKADRGKRAKELRLALGLTSDAFAHRVNAAAASIGLHCGLDEQKVSKIERGVRDLSFDDVAAFEVLDPQQRGWRWFAFGFVPRSASSYPVDEEGEVWGQPSPAKRAKRGMR